MLSLKFAKSLAIRFPFSGALSGDPKARQAQIVKETVCEGHQWVTVSNTVRDKKLIDKTEMIPIEGDHGAQHCQYRSGKGV